MQQQNRMQKMSDTSNLNSLQKRLFFQPAMYAYKRTSVVIAHSVYYKRMRKDRNLFKPSPLLTAFQSMELFTRTEILPVIIRAYSDMNILIRYIPKNHTN